MWRSSTKRRVILAQYFLPTWKSYICGDVEAHFRLFFGVRYFTVDLLSQASKQAVKKRSQKSNLKQQPTNNETSNVLTTNKPNVHNKDIMKRLSTTLIFLSQIIAPCLATLSVTLAPSEEFCFTFKTPKDEPAHIT